MRHRNTKITILGTFFFGLQKPAAPTILEELRMKTFEHISKHSIFYKISKRKIFKTNLQQKKLRPESKPQNMLKNQGGVSKQKK